MAGNATSHKNNNNSHSNHIEMGYANANANGDVEAPQIIAHEFTPLLKRMDSSSSSIGTLRGLPGMKIRAHAIHPDGSLHVCTTREALKAAKITTSSSGGSGSSGKNRNRNKNKSFNNDDNDNSNETLSYWIDIDADDRDGPELKAWLDQLESSSSNNNNNNNNTSLPSFFLARLSEPPHTWASQVIPLQTAALAIIRILPEQPESDMVAHLAALSIQNRLLLTFTSCPRSETGGLYEEARRTLAERSSYLPPFCGSSGILVSWLLFHVERTSTALRDLRYHIVRMDEAMDRDLTSVSLDEIIQAKNQLLRLLSVAEEQTECLESLQQAGSAGGRSGDVTTANAAATSTTTTVEARRRGLEFGNLLLGNVGVLVATAGATERMALRLEKHIIELRQRHESHQQDRINRRLAVLTVISAIFLPLTLVTGIWGMNFVNMPELNKPDAYPLALMGMLTIAISMLCFFWRSGWFE